MTVLLWLFLERVGNLRGRARARERLWPSHGVPGHMGHGHMGPWRRGGSAPMGKRGGDLLLGRWRARVLLPHSPTAGRDALTGCVVARIVSSLCASAP